MTDPIEAILAVECPEKLHQFCSGTGREPQPTKERR